MHVCVCVCMCVCMYVYVGMFVCVYVYVCIFVSNNTLCRSLILLVKIYSDIQYLNKLDIFPIP